MSRWAEPIREFHQLITPDGQVYDLHTASKNGRWVMSSQGWGMPGVDWITQQSPFQHGATVMDYRLQPRMIQLLVSQSFCDRDAFWSGRETLLNALRPNRTPIEFTDNWVARSQYQGGGIYPSGDDQSIINDLAIFNDMLYGGSGADASGTGGILLVWDGAGSWVNAADQMTAYDGVDTETATDIRCLLTATKLVPVFGDVLSDTISLIAYTTNGDADTTVQGDLWRAQTFTPTANFVLDTVTIQLWVSSAEAIPEAGIITVGIYETDGTGKPTGNALCVSTRDSDFVTLSTPGSWYSFGDNDALSRSSLWSVPNVTLSAGTQYAIVVSTNGTDALQYLNWRVDAASAWGAGVNYAYASANGGQTWAADGTATHMFRVRGRNWITTKTGEETREVLLAGGSTEGIVVPWDGVWQEDMGAQHYGTETTIHDMLQWAADGEVYCSSGGSGLLLRYDVDLTTGYGSFTLAADTLTASDVYCVAVYDSGAGEHIYGGTDEGTLVKWDSTLGNAWTQVCAQANGDQTAIWDLVVHNGYLYGCTAPDGYLVRYDVAGAEWDVVSQSLGQPIYALSVHRGRLYGAGADGYLYRWNDADTWDVICPQYIGAGGLIEQILCMLPFNARLMAGTQTGAYLLEWVRERTYNQPQCTALRRLLHNGQKRDLCVFIADGPKFDADDGGWNAQSFKEMLRFIAYQPTLYDPDMVTVPYLVGAGVISEYEDIDYEGTWQSYPTLVFTGPMSSPTVIHEGIDEYIKMEYDIPAGDVVTIDISQGTIEDNHGVNLMGTLTADSALATFRLVPEPELPNGTNRVRLVAGSATADSDFEVQYYTRYIGI